MPLVPEAAQADRELEHKRPESATKSASSQDFSAHSLGSVLGSMGAHGSSPLVQRRANGATRALVMRSIQQGVGNHRAQQWIAQRQCACGGTCASCQSKAVPETAVEEKSALLQRQPAEAGSNGLTAESNVGPPNGAGESLDSATRQFMEPRFGHDFSGVRVHNDAQAAQSADTLSADAYTTGQDIYFAAGKYAPTSGEGRHLLAHELTHVVQQKQMAASSQFEIVPADHESEREAEAAARSIDAGSLPSPSAQVSGIQRQATENPPGEADIDQAALEQCVAELGGSTGYRDGGKPSDTELARYRQECLERQTKNKPGANSKAIENLNRAWEFAKEDLSDDVKRELEGLFSLRSIAVMAVFALLYIGSQFSPIGWIADALALTLLTLSVVLVGAMVIDIAKDLLQYFEAVNATTDDELRECGHALSRALARAGVGIVVALLTHAMKGLARPSGGAPPPTEEVEALAPNGQTVRVTVAATVGEVVAQSRLQQLASYAVMVPPPGGTTPEAPKSSGGKSGGGEPSERTGDPGAAGFKLIRTPYGQGPLSQLAQAMRLKIGLRRGGNVAVFEFDNIPDAFRKMAARLGGRNTYIEGNRMATQNVSGSAHSEELADSLIQAGRNAKLDLTVRRIYTEYNPCTDTCLPLIQTKYPNVEVTFSFLWEKWGRETPDRNAAVDALFGQQGK